MVASGLGLMTSPVFSSIWGKVGSNIQRSHSLSLNQQIFVNKTWKDSEAHPWIFFVSHSVIALPSLEFQLWFKILRDVRSVRVSFTKWTCLCSGRSPEAVDVIAPSSNETTIPQDQPLPRKQGKGFFFPALCSISLCYSLSRSVPEMM